MVLPVDIGNAFIERARAMGWHLRLRTDVAETELRPPHRVLLAFSPTAGECFSDRLAIRGPEQQYSEGFTALTEDFYLFYVSRGREYRRAAVRQRLRIVEGIMQTAALLTQTSRSVR